jgi:ribonucleoside-diphosphate reductase alpha chain
MLQQVERPTLPPVAQYIWDKKYRLKEWDGTPLDLTLEDTFRRVARGLANAERSNHRDWEEAFYSVLQDYSFVPAGRILTGAGTGLNVTLFNCFVMGEIPDSMKGIFEELKRSALTMQMGGGIGMDFSSLRPSGARVRRIGGTASGPLSFMDTWDAMCKTIKSASHRRGAMMAVMHCSHPNVEEFIAAKFADKSRFTQFNLSVLVTDKFYEQAQIETDEPNWPLTFKGKHYKTINARALWNKIIGYTYERAEPGVIFIDRVNRTNNLRYCETIRCSNPCGEQMLPPFGACLLGSINLTQFIDKPFAPEASFNFEKLEYVVPLAIRMMDNVIDVSRFPLEQQDTEAHQKRRLGLGVMGLADALAMLGYRYGTLEAASKAAMLQEHIDLIAYRTSVDLALEKGPFPLFNKNHYLEEGTHASTLPSDLKEAIREHGIRNSHLTSDAPTGTIAQFAGNVSSGIEPIFAYEFDRKITEPTGEKKTHRLKDYAVELWEQLYPDKPLPDYFVTAQELTPKEHIRMLAACQKHVDSSVSKTVNCPAEMTFEEFKGVYDLAYTSGVKCCSTFRPTEKTGSILSVVKEEKKEEKPLKDVIETQVTVSWSVENGLRSRPDILRGSTYKIKLPASEHAIYVTINDDEDGQPFEIFFNTKDASLQSWLLALGRMLSAVFRRGGDCSFVYEELKAIWDPKGGHWAEGKYVPSLIAGIGDTIEKHIRKAVHPEMPSGPVPTDPPFLKPLYEASEGRERAIPDPCPKCGGASLVRQSGCERCLSCGYDKCD